MPRALHAAAILIGWAAAFAAGCADPAPPEAEGPARILSLTPNVTEILFAMGLGGDVVGRSTYCDYPPEARRLPAVGDTVRLNLEKVVALEPTLAFLVTKRDDVVGGLERLGVRTVALESDTMPELIASIRIIGTETGRRGAAEILIARIEADLEAVRRSVRGRPRPKVLFAFPMTVGSTTMMVAGRGSFVDELLAVAGAENAYPEAADWPAVSPERVVALGPEVVLVHAAGEGAPDRLDAIRRAWANWPGIPAVRDGRVHVLTEPFLTIPGPRVGEAARVIAETIHPDLRAGGGDDP